MTAKARWRLAFLLVTTLAVSGELVAAFDGDTDTEPWTTLIVDHVPAPVTYGAIAVLLLWLPAHFAVRYARRRHAAPPDGR